MHAKTLSLVAIVFLSGFGLVLYVGLWIFIPEEDEAQSLGAATYAEARRAYEARSQKAPSGFGTTPVPDARIPESASDDRPEDSPGAATPKA